MSMDHLKKVSKVNSSMSPVLKLSLQCGAGVMIIALAIWALFGSSPHRKHADMDHQVSTESQFDQLGSNLARLREINHEKPPQPLTFRRYAVQR